MGKNDLIFYDVDFVVYFYMYNGFYKCIICSINILKKKCVFLWIIINNLFLYLICNKLKF